MNTHIKSARAYLGGMAMGLGIIGLFLFAWGIPLTIFGAQFWTGMGYREGVQPSAEQLASAVDQAFWWGAVHRLLPLFMISILAISYGLYEALNEKRGVR